MALEQKLTAKLSQRLVMTPSLQQAIKLLQMSKLDLVEEVNRELEDNPVLEDGATTTDPSSDAPAEATPAEPLDPNADPGDGSALGEIDYESFEY